MCTGAGGLHGRCVRSHPSAHAGAEPAAQTLPALSEWAQDCHPCLRRAATPPVTPPFLLGARAKQQILILCQFLCLPVENGFSFTRFRVKSPANGNNLYHPCERAAGTLPGCVVQAQAPLSLCLPLPTSETHLALDVCPFFFPFLHAA